MTVTPDPSYRHRQLGKRFAERTVNYDQAFLQTMPTGPRGSNSGFMGLRSLLLRRYQLWCQKYICTMKTLHALSQRQPIIPQDKSRILNPRLRPAPPELGNANPSSPHKEHTPISEQVCKVRLGSFEMEQFPSRKLTLACDHEATVCQSCLATSISTPLKLRLIAGTV